MLDDAIDLLAPMATHVRLPGVRGHRTNATFTDDLTERDAIPVVTGERALVDLSGALAKSQLGRVLNEGLRRKVIRLEPLRRCAGRLAPAPGRRMAVVHDLLAARLPGFDPGDSDLETRALHALVAAGLPAPVQQHRVVVDGRTYHIDLAYPDERVAIELDGFRDHGPNRVNFERDRQRGNAIVLAGWTLLRFTAATPNEEMAATAAAALQRPIGQTSAA